MEPTWHLQMNQWGNHKHIVGYYSSTKVRHPVIYRGHSVEWNELDTGYKLLHCLSHYWLLKKWTELRNDYRDEEGVWKVETGGSQIVGTQAWPDRSNKYSVYGILLITCFWNEERRVSGLHISKNDEGKEISVILIWSLYSYACLKIISGISCTCTTMH